MSQVIVSSTDEQTLKPLVEAAIRSQLRELELGIQRTHMRLRDFEDRYHLPTDEFHRRLTEDELEETLEFIEWEGERKLLAALEEDRHVLLNSRVWS
jgi:hypothetical protein